jgi:biogenesis of lysosome-related organelles complex 1 subunit 2
MACPNEKEAGMQQQDNLADSLNDLFISVSNMVKSELQVSKQENPFPHVV